MSVRSGKGPTDIQGTNFTMAEPSQPATVPCFGLYRLMALEDGISLMIKNPYDECLPRTDQRAGHLLDER